MPRISSPRLNEENDDLCRFLKTRLKVHPYRLQTLILSLLASTVFIVFMTVSAESRGDSVNISATYQTPANIDVLLTATYLNVQSNQTFTAVLAPFHSTLPPLLMSATEHIMRATQSAIVTPDGTLTDTLQVCELGIATRYRRDLSQEAIADLEQSGLVYSNVNIYSNYVVNYNGICNNNVPSNTVVDVTIFVPSMRDDTYLATLSETIANLFSSYVFDSIYGFIELRVKYIDSSSFRICSLPPIEMYYSTFNAFDIVLDSSGCDRET